MSNIIVISAHPDDETFGVGGTILRHKSVGDDVYWLIVTQMFEKQGFSKEQILTRNAEIKKVSVLYGFNEVIILNYPTMTLSDSSLITLVPDISEVFMNIKPNIIYTLNRSDAHSDHRVIFNSVMACTKSFRYPFIREVLMYECISETEFAPALAEKAFVPNCFIDISSFMDKKTEIMNVYISEIGEHPFPRSERNLKALATFRGAIAGVEYAEAFQIIKFLKIEHI